MLISFYTKNTRILIISSETIKTDLISYYLLSNSTTVKLYYQKNMNMY